MERGKTEEDSGLLSKETTDLFKKEWLMVSNEELELFNRSTVFLDKGSLSRVLW